MSLPARKYKRWLLAGGVGAWVLLLGAGLKSLLLYANTPGAAAHPPALWPARAEAPFAGGQYNLLLFLHPQCPCSRASIGELARIVARRRSRLSVTVFFYVPKGAPRDWALTDLWESAGKIPGVQRFTDTEAEAARRFGARTSGQALLYTPDGRLAFSGGITAMRGHPGDNDGEETILAAVAGEHPSRRTAPVFGCALYGETL